MFDLRAPENLSFGRQQGAFSVAFAVKIFRIAKNIIEPAPHPGQTLRDVENLQRRYCGGVQVEVEDHRAKRRRLPGLETRDSFADIASRAVLELENPALRHLLNVCRFRSRVDLELEVLALRHQLSVAIFETANRLLHMRKIGTISAMMAK